MNIAASKISAASDTGVGAHSEKVDKKDKGDAQFEIDDDRSVEEVLEDMRALGLQPVMNDYVYCG